MARTTRHLAGKNHLAPLIGLLVALLWAYWPAWHGQPVWDDDAHMTRPELRSVAGLVRIWTELGATQQYYPLVHSVFWAEHRLFGDGTLGYHLVNILLHWCSALLLVAILRRLRIPGAWLAGGIFALHPVMVESVAWITELKNTLSGVFYLGAALQYLRFDEERQKRSYALALVLFSIGLLAKSVIVTLPAALLVVFWWKRGAVQWKRDVVPLLPFFAIGAGSGLFTAWVERRYIGAVGSEFAFTVLDRCLIAGRAVWFYLSKLFVPTDLIFIYPRWHIDDRALWQYLFPVALLLVAALSWHWRTRSRGPLAVLLYFVVTLFPALGFFNVYPFRYSFVADHFQYLAALGPIAAAAAGIEMGTGLLSEGSRRSARSLLTCGLLCVLFLLSWKQSAQYRDAETLYRATIQKNRGCWMAHYNLGILLAKEGKPEEAEAQYRQALEIHPRHAKAHINLGTLLARTGRADQAIAHYEKALAINPGSAEAHYDVGIVLAETGRRDEARAHYQKALAINPNAAEVHFNLGSLLQEMGRTDEARTHYLRALAIQPRDAAAHNSLGILLAEMGRTDEAVAHLEQALELEPRHASAHNNLGIVLARKGRTEEAMVHWRKALVIDPGEVGALRNLAFALVEKGQRADATAVVQNALVLARSAGDEARAGMIGEVLAKISR
jgi:protein O-mannosyl-transferase